MKITFKCTEKEIAAILKNNGKKHIEDAFKDYLDNKSLDFKKEASPTIGELIRELGIRKKATSTLTNEDSKPIGFRENSECFED